MLSWSRQAKGNHLNLLDKDMTMVDKAILFIRFEQL